jgi:hypothetical protein
MNPSERSLLRIPERFLASSPTPYRSDHAAVIPSIGPTRLTAIWINAGRRAPQVALGETSQTGDAAGSMISSKAVSGEFQAGGTCTTRRHGQVARKNFDVRSDLSGNQMACHMSAMGV